MSISDTRAGQRASEDSKLVIGPGKKTNISQAVRMAMKEIIYIRESRTGVSKPNTAEW